ncbi:hypothetical protein ZYGR_0AK05600 [Zygosaccharomyces rouxii]|uniref:Phosphatidylinositol N-acetylglucosaminyltransferase subunit GPI19 n=1 Tax=Zygosaccharomyces rouxii TaxID=4956 RepID=A0A1Q3AEE0_ZYGRO|nr:hypothetical protein ZYGR_0AK05600 [Zygosaccharomyces rouxii]
MNKDYSKEYEWFAYYITATSVLIFTIIWSLLPEQNELNGTIHVRLFQALLDILPQRKWIIYLQCLILMGMLYTYLALIAYNEDVLMPPLDSLNTVTDTRGRLAVVEDEQKFLDNFAFKETSALLDLPIMDVCEILHGDNQLK